MAVAVIDFETTGSSPGQGARATEIAVVLVEDGQITGRWSSLMNSGAWVPPFIEALTGISNEMLAQAPAAETVMREAVAFIDGRPLVAHNAAFDRAFWQAEARRAGCDSAAAWPFACTVRLSRRLFPQAPNHRLGTLAAWHGLPDAGRAHRALADATTTAHLLLRLQAEIAHRLQAEGSDGTEDTCTADSADHALLCRLQASPVARVALALQREAAGHAQRR